MAIVRIVHLSDLHFRQHQTKNFAVWENVCDFLSRPEERPDAIFITGDLMDGASPDEFTYAQQCLSRLPTKLYRVIPGNHDRFLYLGNSANRLAVSGD